MTAAAPFPWAAGERVKLGGVARMPKASGGGGVGLGCLKATRGAAKAALRGGAAVLGVGTAAAGHTGGAPVLEQREEEEDTVGGLRCKNRKVQGAACKIKFSVDLGVKLKSVQHKSCVTF